MLGKKTAPQEAPKPNNRDYQPTIFEITRARTLMIENIRRQCDIIFEEKDLKFIECREDEDRILFEFKCRNPKNKIHMEFLKAYDGLPIFKTFIDSQQFRITSLDENGKMIQGFLKSPPECEC